MITMIFFAIQGATALNKALRNLLMTFGLRADEEQNREKLIELLNR